nr:MAG TPA: hypothetical protein [Caudoviricetes sp.]
MDYPPPQRVYRLSGAVFTTGTAGCVTQPVLNQRAYSVHISGVCTCREARAVHLRGLHKNAVIDYGNAAIDLTTANVDAVQNGVLRGTILRKAHPSNGGDVLKLKGEHIWAQDPGSGGDGSSVCHGIADTAAGLSAFTLSGGGVHDRSFPGNGFDPLPNPVTMNIPMARYYVKT